ncbi:hypothetical protein [Lactobacillus delbrueckii]|uniref:hypothetical protein n=1 Tax=Lactobacillus delbrueckii TaxID=1584 RepID=UPI0007CD8528|nr:hypothetical protein [Lactobacillus delbrueckii]MBT8856324.1 hypothetical protein [Lactobacillus delbrueckii subsp. bulgaricus]MBT8886469.1 hypothetical protein [Lactobacillus delbrueckii subsp. bulgaricus]MBT8926666.1 hypothetical protein [Lactobacillus delbrueckii subsp. bulgaricus]MBT9022530.1 hypothetical protein [Lactobacillus delbrueckii subsp. bulgaricus]MCD5459108.1 hypothetical protein [Lactobacillus delbrueckii subsp. bulgaricus]
MGSNKHKRGKIVKQKCYPSERKPVNTQNPDAFYKDYPSWNFATVDTDKWAFTQDHIGKAYWTEILPHMQALETQKWSDILLTSKKQNHSIELDKLNKVAQDRLAEKMIEAEAIVSLRFTATHRLYGFMVGSVFNVLWYDDDHGDNKDCVCRSYKKHT